jgi:hypothetical protein
MKVKVSYKPLLEHDLKPGEVPPNDIITKVFTASGVKITDTMAYITVGEENYMFFNKQILTMFIED